MTTWADLGVDPATLDGGNQYFQCPRCSPSREKAWKTSLSVNGAKGAFKCHHCGWSGYVDGTHALTTDLTYSSQDTAYKIPEPRELQPLNQEALDWFKARDISRDVLELNGIEMGQGFKDADGTRHPAVFFPYFRDGKLVNRKRRRLDVKAFGLETGCELIPFGLDNIDPDEDEVIICEGEMDLLAWNTVGVYNVISVPNGAPPADVKAAESHLRWLGTPHLERLHGRVRRWILDMDADAPGKRLGELLAHQLGNEKVYLTRKPDGCKDANDVLVQHGPSALRSLLETVRPLPVQGLWEANDPQISDALEGAFEDDNPNPGFSLGFATLDPLIRVMPGNFCVLTGIPGMGKGEFIDQVAVNLANEYGWRTAFFSPENSPIHLHVRKLIEKKVGLSMRSKYGPAWKMDIETMRKARRWVDEYFTFVLPTEDDWRLSAILKLFEHAIFRKNVKNIVLDPWNEISHARDGNGESNETDVINAELSKIKRFGLKHGVLTWVVAHPTKMRAFTGQDGIEQFPVPKLYDISGSAHFANRADFGVSVHRDPSKSDKNGHQNLLDVHVLKARWKDQGETGNRKLQWDRVSGRLTSDLSRLKVPEAVEFEQGRDDHDFNDDELGTLGVEI